MSHTVELTHYVVHPKRGREVLDAIDILPQFQETKVQVSWISYQGYVCKHVLCNVHHLQDLINVEEQAQQPWAKALLELLLWMEHEAQAALSQGASCLAARCREELIDQYRLVLEERDQLNREELSRGKHERPKHNTARNLLNRLFRQDQVLTFLYTFVVPFDNSQTEQLHSHAQGAAESFRCVSFRLWSQYFLSHPKLPLSLANAWDSTGDSAGTDLGHPLFSVF